MVCTVVFGLDALVMVLRMLIWQWVEFRRPIRPLVASKTPFATKWWRRLAKVIQPPLLLLLLHDFCFPIVVAVSLVVALVKLE